MASAKASRAVWRSAGVVPRQFRHPSCAAENAASTSPWVESG
ncbi:Uncharacterised protein [Mycobacteroides abscessus subsp. abscessus]|nr:Uncharacterised protein [Mycobacteroides abscessus subsp. abscessus]